MKEQKPDILKEDKEEADFLDSLIDKGFDLVKTIATNPAGIGILAIAGGMIIKQLPASKTETKLLQGENRYRLSVEGIKLIYGAIVNNSADMFDIHGNRIARSFVAEHDRCVTLLNNRDIEFDTSCEVYNTGSTTIKTEVPTGYDPIIDLFPFDLFGLVPKETGEIKLSDALILAGIIAIGGQFLKR